MGSKEEHLDWDLACCAVSHFVLFFLISFNKDEKCRINRYLPTTVGSKSTKTALGTCFPAPVSLKNVLKESSPPPMVLSLGIWPSGWIPCSRQYSSQHAFPIWTPACPTWIEIHSLYKLWKFWKNCDTKLLKKISDIHHKSMHKASTEIKTS